MVASDLNIERFPLALVWRRVGTVMGQCMAEQMTGPGRAKAGAWEMRTMLDAAWRWNPQQQRDKGVKERERSRRWVLRLLAKTRMFWTCGSVLSFCLSDKVSSKLGSADLWGPTPVSCIAAHCRELRNVC